MGVKCSSALGGIGFVSLGICYQVGENPSYKTTDFMEEVYTSIPPSITDTKVFTILGFRNDAAAFLLRLRDDVVGLASAFFDKDLAGAVGDVGFCG